MSPIRMFERGLRPPGARVPALAILLALVLVALVAAGAVYARHERSDAADRLYLRMVATDDEPWRVPASRVAARAIAERHPDSRWASEAWRVIALDAESRCDTPTAVAAWGSFVEFFSEARGPGIAYGQLSVARLHEADGEMRAADRHYRAALRSIASVENRMQTWIAIDAARSVARIRRGDGEWAETIAWEVRADRLARAHGRQSIEEAQ